MTELSETETEDLAEKLYSDLLKRFPNRAFIYCDLKQHLVFTVHTLQRAVGKDHLTFTKPRYKPKSKQWFIEIAYDIPKAVMRSLFSPYNPTEETEQ